MSVSPQITPNTREPSTFLQRPTSAKIPDVSHLLNSIFGDKYAKDKLSADIVKNLTVSSDVDNQYHKRYVQKLKEAQLIKESRVQEYAMLEKHILEAQAKALAYEDREEDKRHKTCEEPDLFGVPPTKSYFSYCLDDTLLKDHDLLVPSDYYSSSKRPFVPMPKNQGYQGYLSDTVSSKERVKQKAVLPPINSARKFDIEDIGDLHKSGSTLSDEFDYESDTKESSEIKIKKTKPFWKDTLRQEERIYDREYLKKLQTRTNFLPNPRLEASRIAQLSSNTETVFEIVPQTILFNKYIIGKVYESSFEIRNISTVAHQFRAIPPKKQFFSLSLGQYPQTQSLIAPGLSVLFNVRFSPDSLCSFEDEILVECSNGSKLIVPLIAKRESPCLSIGSFLNCGHSLVGQIKGCRFVIQNFGGDGRFVIFQKSSWPATTFKTNVLSTTLNMYPFEIQPSIFELRKDDIFVLEVVFKPPDNKKYEQDIVIACDNCTTIEFKLIGEGKLAEIEYIDSHDFDQNTQNLIAIDDFKDKLSSKILRFPSLNPKALTRKRFSVKNNSQCPIDFSWQLFKPVFEDNLSAIKDAKNLNYNHDNETFFSVVPRQGTFERDEAKTFEVIFNPDKVGMFESVAHLLLHGLPEINKQMLLDASDTIHKTHLNKEDISTSDFLATAIELRGECEAFQFTLDPPAIFVPGPIYMQSTTRKAFRLINMSICPINFKWKQILEPHILQVEPSYGEIAPKSYALMDILITGLTPGKILEDIACYVEYSEEPIYLHVEAEIKGPELQIKEAGVDFGLVRIGDSSKSFVTLENISNLPLNWNLECLDNQNLFDFPRSGSLLPLESKTVQISFHPKQELILNTQFTVNVQNGNTLTFNCHAQAQQPKISFINSEIILDELYLNVEKVFIAKLANHSVLDASFIFQKPIGEDVSMCEIFYEQLEGIIQSRATVQCFFRIKSHQIKSIDDLRIPCYIPDTNEIIFLDIKGTTKDISVDILISNEDNYYRTDLVDFETVQMGEKVTKKLILKNTSGIRTFVNLEVQNFKAIEQIENEKLFIDPSKRTLSLIDKFKLANEHNGIGFGLERNCFELPEFSSVSILIIAVPDFWGYYEDFLKIKINGIEQIISIPIRINVMGTPIKLFTGKVFEHDEVSMIRFGSSTQGQTAVVRKISLQNTSVIPVEINWKVFLINSPDNQLIDVNLVPDESNDQQIGSPTSNYARTNSRSSSTLFIKNQIEPIQELRESVNSDYYYYYEERRPLVKINLTSHYGSEQEVGQKVFSLDKNTLNLKPRERSSLQITFNTNINKCQAYEAIFVGYLSLPLNYVEGQYFSRKINYEKEPVIFKATGTLESPNLIVEYDNDDLSFVVSTGDLINAENELVKEKVFNNQISLLNASLSPIEFQMNIKSPFHFSNNSLSLKKQHLKSKSKIQCPIQFKFDMDFLSKIKFNENTSPVIHNDFVHINFPNSEQKIEFSTKIYTPQIQVTMESINFGTTLVDQERQAQFLIRNYSFSSALWNISIDDEDEVFRCDISKGFLESNKTNINKCQQLINVYFNAKNNKSYCSRLKITLEPHYGTRPVFIELKGAGSYDQKLDAILNV